ncbi:MAG: 30S ribosomal protein S13 [Candidatus Altiarchaeota archaeon]
MAEAKEEKKPEVVKKSGAPEKKPDKKHEKPEKEKPKEDKIANRVRVAGVILDGSLDVKRAITGIKGVGTRIAKSLAKALGIKKGVKLSSLSETEIEEIEKALSSLDKSLPPWMLNRRKDYVSGLNIHLTGPELDITNRSDIDRHKKIRSYKGVRHSLNLPVRGQRTRSSFRTGGTIGVVRKKEQPAEAGDKKTPPQKK